jgi:hypothetical protein
LALYAWATASNNVFQVASACPAQAALEEEAAKSAKKK